MPKGQYQRKPKSDDVEVLPPAAPDDLVIGSPVTVDPEPEIERIAALLVPSVPLMPNVPTRESFDDWLDADAMPPPANDRITQVVGEWAASFCEGEHSVTWMPSLDRRNIAVTLITPFGTSDLTADAGRWNEADIAAALAGMRQELGV